ncbi:MAG: hypothetical protein LH609_02570 [Rudanella sp.]|nr:hypothetical protein [Rudanella sp.]
MIREQINFAKELAEAERQSAESLKVLQQHGFVVDTAEWLTIKRYAEKYGVSQQVVVNWLNRGVVPADCTMVLHEFNDMRLVKDQSYR